MATTVLAIRPVGVRASAISGHRRPGANSAKTSPSNWWSPVFGWSAEPDYIDTNGNKSEKPGEMDHEDGTKPSARPRVSRGSFTAEKAKQLRKLTTESSTFHDVMYHSAIASRLASEFSER